MSNLEVEKNNILALKILVYIQSTEHTLTATIQYCSFAFNDDKGI